MEITRRNLLKLISSGILANSLPINLAGCSKNEPFLRIASNVWPGYELIYLARESNYFSNQEIRLIEVPSATVCIQTLAAGTSEGAMLTLDEVLTARSEGLNLEIVAILDISMGADVLMASKDIKQLHDLSGKRIGVEQSAVGAIMLDAILKQGQIKHEDIETHYMTVNQHREAFNNKQVDALITFEPVKTQLESDGAHSIFDSSQIPGRIIDVLAVLPGAIKHSPNNIGKLISAHFLAMHLLETNPSQASKIIARRLQLKPEDVPDTYTGISLPDIQQNHEWLQGRPSRLETSATELMEIMLSAKLLSHEVSLSNLVNPEFLPAIQ